MFLWVNSFIHYFGVPHFGTCDLLVVQLHLIHRQRRHIIMRKGWSFWQGYVVLLALAVVAKAESPYRFFDWNVTYGEIFPLGVRQQVCYAAAISYSFISSLVSICWKGRFVCSFFQGILINGQFPGPDIYSVTNDNLIINVHNYLDEPFLLSWYVMNQMNIIHMLETFFVCVSEFGF